MKLSIIIVNWNTKDLTLACVKSIFKHKPSFKFEVIVVDNGSTDGSLKAFEKLKVIKIINNKKNLGFAKANNIGIRHSKGDYTLLLNSDTKVTKSALNKLVEFAEKTPNAGVVGAKLLEEDGAPQASVYRAQTLTNYLKHYWFGQKSLLNKYYPRGNNPTKVEALVAAAFLITPAARNRVGLLNGQYFMYYEDLDYCRRIHKAGLNVYYLPNATVIHLHGASGMSVAKPEDQWKRLIPGSKLYHGLARHYAIQFVIKVSQKLNL